MGKDCEGRQAGHHLTPGRGWRWQQFGDRLMLVTDGGGADVVLSIAGKPQAPKLATCGPDGVMRPLAPDHPLARLLESVPDLVAIAREIEAQDDRPRYLPRLRDALQKAGLFVDPLAPRNGRRVEIANSDARPFAVVLRRWGPGELGEQHGENVSYMRREHAELAAARWLDHGKN